jgi:hypothetical protein
MKDLNRNFSRENTRIEQDGGRDQEDCGSKPAQANSSQNLISKTPNTKEGCWSSPRCRPSTIKIK